MISFKNYMIFLAFIILGTIGIFWLNISNLKTKTVKIAIVKIPYNQIKFNAYLKKFNKSYSGDEYFERLGHFEKSLEKISVLNSEEGTGAKHGLTKFSDLSQEEFSKMMHNPAYGSQCTNYHKACNKLTHYMFLFRRTRSSAFFDDIFYPNNVVENAFDWRDHNIVGPVLDQKKCLGCWAFGIIGLMESMEVKQRLRPYTQRSIQELIDCSFSNDSCNGGNVRSALLYLCSSQEGIITEDEYPLKLMKRSCNRSLLRKFKKDGRKLSWYSIGCDMNKTDIISKIYNYGPVITVVNAEPWQHYTKGVIHRGCYRSLAGNTIDHVVQIVGYNLTAEIPYYIIKNSWGEDFGENGYVRVAMEGNVCGVSDEITYLGVK